MNTNKTIENIRQVGDDYFGLCHLRSSNKYLNNFLPLFNFNDYHCLKSTRHQIFVTYEEFIEFKYSRYILFKKDIYNKEHISMWIEWMISIGGIQYLSRPTPPFSPNKIIIRK